MTATSLRCSFKLDGVEFDKRIFEDDDGDWFLEYSGRFFDYELFCTKVKCTIREVKR